jgi:tape measure domain-containing protein
MAEVFGLSIALKEVGGKVVKASVDALRVVLADAAKEARKTDKAVSDLGAQFRTLAATITAGVGVRELVGMADSYSTLSARLALTTANAEELASVQGELFDLAQKQRVPLEAVSELYGRVALASEDLGLSQRQIIDFTRTVSQTLVISGTSADQAAGSLMQLGQALGGGVVRAEEFNSILEGTPRLARAAAESMGLNVSQLRNLVIQGKLSSAAFAQAILDNKTVAAEFARIPTTIGQALTQFRNQMLVFIGNLNNATGATKAVVDVLNTVRENLPQIAAAITSAAAAWAAYNIAIKAAIGFSVIITSAQTVAAFVALAKTVRSVADGMALLSIVGGGVVKIAAVIAAMTAGMFAYQKVLEQVEKLSKGVFEPLTGGGGAGAAGAAAGATAGEQAVSAFEEYFRQAGLGRRATPIMAVEVGQIIDPAKLRASAQEVGALINTEFRDNVLAVAESLGQQLRDTLASGIASAFETLVTRGATIGDAFGALGATLLRGLGDMLVTFGTALLPVAKLFAGVVASLKSLNPVAMTAAAVGLIAIGGMMRGAAGRAFGGIGGGSAPVTAGGGLGGLSGPSTLPGLTFGPTMASSASSVSAMAPVAVTIIGPNDPQAQRQMQELIRNANRRGNIMGA